MGYKRAFARLLDRPGGRFVLGKIATIAGKHIARSDVKVAYIHGQWTTRIGANLILGGPRFYYAPEAFQKWEDRAAQYIFETRDFWLRFYEPREGDTIIDVGAGHGENTFAFSRAVGESGRVIAIEAHPLSFKALRTFCRLNHLSNVTPIHLALMDKAGQVRIAESESWTENSVTTNGGASAITVRAGTLDYLCLKEKIAEISFLKMNIEGAERYALLGAEKTMSCTRKVCVACHDFRANQGHGEQFRTRSFVERFLAEHGFTTALRPDDPRDYIRDHVYGLRPGR